MCDLSEVSEPDADRGQERRPHRPVRGLPRDLPGPRCARSDLRCGEFVLRPPATALPGWWPRPSRFAAALPRWLSGLAQGLPGRRLRGFAEGLPRRRLLGFAEAVRARPPQARLPREPLRLRWV